MQVQGRQYRSIWPEPGGKTVAVIDQTLLPHRFSVARLETLDDACESIARMRVRGAPLIGVTAAYGVALALRGDAGDAALRGAIERLGATRPTAVNLRHALQRMATRLAPLPLPERAGAAWREADAMANEDVEVNRAIGGHGFALLKRLRSADTAALRVLTHCNAGWLATVDHGTALAPLYAAHDSGLAVHVWVSETRPRNQGLLTAWELAQHGVPHTLVVDNACGHLLATGQVDVVIVGADRVSAGGDVCNKVGTYLKALAARRHRIPFYAAVPSSTIDWTITDGHGIPIEERGAEEVLRVRGCTAEGALAEVALLPGTPAANPAFDVTPADLVTGLITERGVCDATRPALQALFHRT
jgi:methylthioribose-1-phosphate isomerase